MTDYSKGKIYKIVVNNTEDEYMPYIGSTTKEYLSQRFVRHRNYYTSYKNGKQHKIVSAFILFDKYGIENCEIVLIENYPCATKDELRARERYWYDNIENCNMCKPIVIESDKPEIYKKQYQRKLELYPDYNKKHYQRKLELCPDYNKKRREVLKNNAEYNEKRKVKHICDCGSHIRKEDKARHEKSKKHLNYITTIAPQQEV